MAGDWIKFELSTIDKPEVWAIATALDLDPDAVIGKLLRVWRWFDLQSRDGHAPTVTKKLLDRDVGVTGFCDAMVSAGWMTDSGSQISIPNFERHNGKSAKERGLATKRKQAERSRLERDTSVTREEKRREENSNRGDTTNRRGNGFQPPTVGEVAEYCRERQNEVNAARFVDFYESKGWQVGKSKMKDWKAAVRGWESREPKSGSTDIFKGALNASNQ